MKNLIFLLLLTSCVTAKKVDKYFAKNPTEIERVFVFDEVHDTTTIIKDSLIVERITDSIYSWFNDTHYIDRVRIKEVLKPCKDSIIIVSKQIYTDRYKKVYELAKKDAEYNEKALKWWRKGLFITWGWIILFGVIIYIIKRR
jgi:hypothetical protein